jgi:hypothetical protein
MEVKVVIAPGNIIDDTLDAYQYKDAIDDDRHAHLFSVVVV